MKKINLLPIAVLLVSGCLNSPTVVRYEAKTYTPVPLRSREHAATLANKRYARDTIGQYSYNLYRIDGVSVATLVARDQLAYLNSGRHVVELDAHTARGGGRREVTFEALPGERYEADGNVLEDRIEMWIQAIDSHRIVSNVAVLPLGGPRLPLFWGK
jgi:hypothetical protein